MATGLPARQMTYVLPSPTASTMEEKWAFASEIDSTIAGMGGKSAMESVLLCMVVYKMTKSVWSGDFSRFGLICQYCLKTKCF
jgi:hypothetical protein